MNYIKDHHPLYQHLLASEYRMEFPSPCPYNLFVLSTSRILIQRRTGASLDFYRTWAEYEEGFGEPLGNMWLGLKYISHISSAASPCLLEIYLVAVSGSRNAAYSSFYLGSSDDNYRLHVSGYFGNAGDSLAYHDGMEFSTHDNDNDQDTRNCGETSRGGWWYKACHEANLNGHYYPEGVITTIDGISWRGFLGSQYSLSASTMQISK